MATINLVDRPTPAPVIAPVSRRSPLRRFVTNGVVIRVTSVALGLLLWQLIGSHYPYSMSSPSAVLTAVRQYLVHRILPAGLQSLKSFSLGFAISVVAGIPIGIAMARIRFIRMALEPYVQTLNSMPMLAIFPLMIVAFGINFQLRVAAAILFGIFPVIVNTMIGASLVDVNYEDVGRSFVASGWKRLSTIIFPACLDYIFVGVRMGFGHAMIGSIVIEIEASAVGLGNLLSSFATYLQLGPFFLVVVILGTFSILFSAFLRRFQRWATMPWTRSAHFSHAAGGSSSTGVITSGPSWGRRVVMALRPVQPLFSGAYRAVAATAHLLTGRITVWILRVVVLVAIVAGWQYESTVVPRAAMPSPHAFATAFYQLTFITGAIWGPLGQTMELYVCGFLLAVVIGIPVGLVLGRFRIVALALEPYVSFLYGLPLVVFVPIFVIWLGFGFNFGLAFIVVSAVWVVIINTMQGVHSASRDLIETGQSFCATERQILRTIVIPNAIPFMVAGARLAFSISWIAVIVSEVISSENGIGGMITNYQTQFLIPDMVVPVVYIALISVILLTIATILTPKLTPWTNAKR